MIEPRERFVMTLEATSAGRGTLVGLRRLLKALCRRYGLKCISVRRAT